jgi:hypothetical protein
LLLAAAGAVLVAFTALCGHKPATSSVSDPANGRTAYLTIGGGRFGQPSGGYVTPAESWTYSLASGALPVGVLLMVLSIAKYPIKMK